MSEKKYNLEFERAGNNGDGSAYFVLNLYKVTPELTSRIGLFALTDEYEYDGKKVGFTANGVLDKEDNKKVKEFSDRAQEILNKLRIEDKFLDLDEFGKNVFNKEEKAKFETIDNKVLYENVRDRQETAWANLCMTAKSWVQLAISWCFDDENMSLAKELLHQKDSKAMIDYIDEFWMISLREIDQKHMEIFPEEEQSIEISEEEIPF